MSAKLFPGDCSSDCVQSETAFALLFSSLKGSLPLAAWRVWWVQLLLLVGVLLLPVSAWAQVCAVPGNDGSASSGGVVNDYYPATNTQLSAGASSVTLGTRVTGGAGKNVAVGDLLLIIQMQDATINYTNTNAYGNGSTGQGSTGVGNSGLYEFVKVTAVNAGGVVTFTPNLTNTYRNQAATSTSGAKTFQVVRVPQYASFVANGVTAPAWNGVGGGVVALDVRDTLTLTGNTVEGQTNRAIFVGGKGFRGASGINFTSGGTANDWAINATSSAGDGGKG